MEKLHYSLEHLVDEKKAMRDAFQALRAENHNLFNKLKLQEDIIQQVANQVYTARNPILPIPSFLPNLQAE